MDLTNLTIDELRKRLDDLDKTESPHEALELSNEIGRRTVVIDEIKKSQIAGIKAVKYSPWTACACILAFIVMSFFNPPEFKYIIPTLAFSLFVTFTYIRFWTKGASIFDGLCIIFIIILSDIFLESLFESLQYISLLICVSMATVYMFSDKILSLIKDNKL